MGITLHLGSDETFPSDTKNGGKAFYNEILNPSSLGYFKAETFLNLDEQRLIEPEYDIDDDTLEKYKKIEPENLKKIFEKVLNHLEDNIEQYPTVHWIYENENRISGSSTSNSFLFNGSKCYLDGFHNDINHRMEIRLVELQNQSKTIEWLKVSSTINLNGINFFIQTENKSDQFRNIIMELIDICEKSITDKKKLIWVFSN